MALLRVEVHTETGMGWSSKVKGRRSIRRSGRCRAYCKRITMQEESVVFGMIHVQLVRGGWEACGGGKKEGRLLLSVEKGRLGGVELWKEGRVYSHLLSIGAELRIASD